MNMMSGLLSLAYSSSSSTDVPIASMIVRYGMISLIRTAASSSRFCVEFFVDVEEGLNDTQLDLFCRFLVCPVDNLEPLPYVRCSKKTTERSLAHFRTCKDDTQVAPDQGPGRCSRINSNSKGKSGSPRIVLEQSLEVIRQLSRYVVLSEMRPSSTTSII